MAGITFKVSLNDNLSANWREAFALFESELAQSVDEAAKEAADSLRTAHPWQDQTYRLVQSIEAKPVELVENEIASEIVLGPFDSDVPTPYASYVDDYYDGAVTLRLQDVSESALEREVQNSIENLENRMK